MTKPGFLEELLSTSEDTIQSTQVSEDKILAPLLDEISQISNDPLRSFVRCVLLNTHANFWTAPAATDPDSHPLDEYKEGGLVLHTKRVMRTAMLIGEAQMRNIDDIDTLIAAALLHDVTKADPAIPTYLHTAAVDKLVESISIIDELDSDYLNRSNTLNFIINYPDQLILLMRMVRSHEGFESPCPELIPVTTLEQILSLSNMVAKSIDRIMDGHEIQRSKWEDDDTDTEDT